MSDEISENTLILSSNKLVKITIRTQTHLLLVFLFIFFKQTYKRHTLNIAKKFKKKKKHDDDEDYK